METGERDKTEAWKWASREVRLRTAKEIFACFRARMGPAHDARPQAFRTERYITHFLLTDHEKYPFTVPNCIRMRAHSWPYMLRYLWLIVPRWGPTARVTGVCWILTSSFSPFPVRTLLCHVTLHVLSVITARRPKASWSVQCPEQVKGCVRQSWIPPTAWGRLVKPNQKQLSHFA